MVGLLFQNSALDMAIKVQYASSRNPSIRATTTTTDIASLVTMEDHKLQALHDTLSKLQGRKGLGTSRQYSWQKKNNSSKASSSGSQPTSNGNPLYSYFHPEGEYPESDLPQHGDGRVIKRNFDDVGSSSSSSSEDKDNTTYRKQKREKKKQRKKERKKAEKKAARKAAKLEAKRLAKLEEKRQAKRAGKANKESEAESGKAPSKDGLLDATSMSKPSDSRYVSAEPSERLSTREEDGKKAKKERKKRKREEGPIILGRNGSDSERQQQASAATTVQKSKKRNKAAR
jgi:hypothetical protein